MNSNLWEEVHAALGRAFRTFVPEPQDRIPVSWNTAPYVFMHVIPLIFICYLARRPNTYLMRLLLLPSLITAALRAGFGYVWEDPRFNVYNWSQALGACTMIAKGIDLALVREGRYKQGERALGRMHEPAVSHKKGVDAPGDELSQHRPGSSFLPTWLEDAVEIMVSLRGLGWDFGRGVHTPAPTRPQDRDAYLRATVRSLAVNFLLFDLYESLLKLVPGVGDPRGGSIFNAALPPLQRYALSTAIQLCTGCTLLAGFGMVYDLCTLVAVGALGHSPSAWPPVMDNPWISQSLHEFWAKRWHQLLRQTFLVFGGYPGRSLAGDVGLVLGTFLASGFYHECTIYAMGRGFDWRVPAFFLAQGVALIGERVWRVVTGRRVGGFFGRLWVYFDMLVLAQPLVDAWHSRGLGGGMIVPPVISPMRQLILPAIRHLASKT